MSDLTARLAAARSLTELGLKLFLLKPRDKKPLHAGWQATATAEYSEISQFLVDNPTANMAVATGGDLLVVDVDNRHDGHLALAELEKSYGALPASLRIKTGGGGLHIYLKLPEGIQTRNTAGRLSTGIDTRGDGGYVVAPGSIHPDGAPYEFDGLARNIAPTPSWLLKRLTSQDTKSVGSMAPAEATFAEGKRNTEMTSVAGFLRRKGAGQHEIEGALKGLNQTLTNPLPTSELDRIAASIARYTASDLESYTERSLADEFAATMSDTLCFAPELGWLRYKDGAWLAEAGEQHAQEQAKSFVLEIERRAKEAAGRQNSRESSADILTAGLRWQRAAPIRNIVKLAESDPAMLTSASMFDATPQLLNLQNGTLDLETRQLRNHRASDRLRKKAGVSFDPSARCPVFDNFIHETLGSEKAEFLMRAFAYSLLGRPNEQKMLLLTGAGRNGKTTLTETIREMMGDYALVMDPSSLLKKNAPTIGNDIARLAGARLVLTSEFSKGAQIDAPLVKKLTGNESVAARFLYKEAFQFEARAVFFLVTNHVPGIDGSDMAMTRRLIVVPFDHVVPEEAVDTGLKAKLMAERSGILNRLLEALDHYRIRGLAMPAAVRTATKSYAFEHDVVAQFIENDCVVEQGASVKAQLLFHKFTSHCIGLNLQTMSDRSFKRTLETKGYSQKRVASGLIWQGLGLRSIPQHVGKPNDAGNVDVPLSTQSFPSTPPPIS